MLRCVGSQSVITNAGEFIEALDSMSSQLHGFEAFLPTF